MQVHGKISRINKTEENAIVEITIPLYQVESVEGLDVEKLYVFNIKEAKGKKSLQQNRTAWLLMTDIAREEDLFPDAEAVYLSVLKLSKIKTDYFVVLNDESIIEMLQRQFRVVKVLNITKNSKGKEIATVEVAEGMSRFTKDEMQTFIEKLLHYAEQVGIDTSEYRFI